DDRFGEVLGECLPSVRRSVPVGFDGVLNRSFALTSVSLFRSRSVKYGRRDGSGFFGFRPAVEKSPRKRVNKVMASPLRRIVTCAERNSGESVEYPGDLCNGYLSERSVFSDDV